MTEVRVQHEHGRAPAGFLRWEVERCPRTPHAPAGRVGRLDLLLVGGGEQLGPLRESVSRWLSELDSAWSLV